MLLDGLFEERGTLYTLATRPETSIRKSVVTDPAIIPNLGFPMFFLVIVLTDEEHRPAPTQIGGVSKLELDGLSLLQAKRVQITNKYRNCATCSSKESLSRISQIDTDRKYYRCNHNTSRDSGSPLNARMSLHPLSHFHVKLRLDFFAPCRKL